MKKLFISIVSILAFSVLADSQTIISGQSLTESNDRVVVSFYVDTDVKSIPSKRKEVIMPYLYDGKDTVWLDVLEVYGKGRFKRERQEKHIAGDKDWELADKQVIKGDTYLYLASTPLKRWMKAVDLGIKRQMVGCACENDMEEETLAENVALFREPSVIRRVPEGFALAEAGREWDFGQDELEIIFKVAKIEIDSTVFENKVTFGKILSALDKIYTNPKYEVSRIEIAGYASPEGGREFNNWLGKNRAQALVDYIIENRPQYDLSEEDFTIRNGMENWAGLRKLLQESSEEYRDEVIAVIDTDLPDEQKKNRIKAMDGGKVWKDMLDDIYPYLRSARYLAVYFDSSNDDAVERINAANELIRNGRYVEAYEMVLPYSDDMRSYNTIGVALMMQRRFEDALPWLEKALENDLPAAKENIDRIKAEYEHEARQKSEIEEYLKKYE